MARRRANLRTQIQRRKRVWARNQAAALGVTQDGLAQELDTAFTADMGTLHLPVGITVGGTMLDFQASRATAGTDITSSQLHVGIICTQETDQLEVPRPLTEPHADWMWIEMITFSDVTVGANSSTFRDLQGPVRAKARRKCEELGEHLWIVWQGYDIAPTFNIQWFSSVLLLLP